MKKVLIVDDQSFIRQVYKAQIEQLAEVSIVEAANGNEALGKAKATHPDLIILDIVMPNKNGLEVLQELSIDSSTQDIPVVVISSHAEEDKKAEAMSLGAKDFIDKTRLNDIDFLGMINGYLGM